MLKALELASVNRGLPGLVGGPTFQALRDTTQTAFFEVLDEIGLKYTFNQQRNTITLPNGTPILFRSLEKPERLRGANLAWVLVDELTFCKRDAWKRLAARVRHPKAKHLCQAAGWTPNGFDWVYDELVTKSGENGIEVILATPRENYFLPQDYYDNLKADYDEKFYRQEALGEYLNLISGAVYFAFSRSENIKHLEYNPALPLCWSLDFNVNPMASVICQIADYAPFAYLSSKSTRHLNVLDEIVLPDSNVPAVCEEFKRRTEGLRPTGGRLVVRVYGDPAGNARGQTGQSNYELIKAAFRNDSRYELQMMVKSSAPRVVDRVNAVNSLLCNAEGDRRCFMTPKCQEVIRDCEQVVWKTDSAGNSTGEINKTKDGMRTHASDSMGYLIEAEFSLTRTTGGYKTGRLV